MNIFLCAFGSGILAAGSMVWVAKNTGNEIKMMRSGGNNSTKYLGEGGKAEQLKDKPRAQDPMAMGAAGGIMAAVGAGLISRIPGGAKNAAKLAGAIGRKLPGVAGVAFNVGKVGVGTAMAAGEFINKRTGLTRHISGFMKPIGKKIRFKATSAAGFLKDQFETEGDRLKNRFNESKQIISGNIKSAKNAIAGKLSDGTKRKIKTATSLAKYYSKWAKEKTISIGADFNETVGMYKDEFGQMARGISNAKKNAWRDFSHTRGYNLAQDGLNNIKMALKSRRGNIVFSDPAILPNLSFTANKGMLQRAVNNAYQNINESEPFTNEGLTEAIKEFKRIKGNTAKDALVARRYAQALSEITSTGNSDENEIKHQLLLNLVNNSSSVLSKDKLVSQTNEMFNFYANHGVMATLKEAQSEAIKQNSRVNTSEIISAFNNNEDAKNQLKRDAQKSGKYNEFETDVYNEIAEDISNGELGERAIKYFGKDGAKKLAENVQTSIQDNITSDFVNKKDEIIKGIEEEKGLSRKEAREYVNNLMNGAFDEDSFKATIEHFITNQDSNTQSDQQVVQQITQQTIQHSQQQIVQNIQNVVSTQEISGDISATQQVAQPQTTSGDVSAAQSTAQQTVSSQQISATSTSEPTTTTTLSNTQSQGRQYSNASTQASNNTNNSTSQNTRTTNTKERIIERVVEKGPKVDTKQITESIAKDLRDGITRDVTKNVNVTLSGYIERFKDGTLKDLENAIKNNGMPKDFYEVLGNGNMTDGKRRFKELCKRGGTVDELLSLVKGKTEQQEITTDFEEQHSKKGRTGKSTNDVA